MPDTRASGTSSFTGYTLHVVYAGVGIGSSLPGQRDQRKVLDSMLGFAGGVMIAASYWLWLVPPSEMVEDSLLPAWIAAAGVMLDFTMMILNVVLG